MNKTFFKQVCFLISLSSILLFINVSSAQVSEATMNKIMSADYDSIIYPQYVDEIFPYFQEYFDDLKLSGILHEKRNEWDSIIQIGCSKDTSSTCLPTFFNALFCREMLAKIEYEELLKKLGQSKYQRDTIEMAFYLNGGEQTLNNNFSIIIIVHGNKKTEIIKPQVCNDFFVVPESIRESGEIFVFLKLKNRLLFVVRYSDIKYLRESQKFILKLENDCDKNRQLKYSTRCLHCGRIYEEFFLDKKDFYKSNRKKYKAARRGYAI